MKPELFSPDDIVQVILEFEKLVGRKREGLNLPIGSQIESAGLTAIEMLGKFRENIPPDFQFESSEKWRQAIALGDMLRKVMRAVDHHSFDKLWPHIMLLLGDANIALNVWNSIRDADANKVFELYVALVAAPLCEKLDLDHPKHSSAGKNPDVIAEFDGNSWAFACKVMHADKSKTFLDRVKEGIEQIQECPNADQGLVVISLKNLLPHNQYWHQKREQSLADMLCPGLVDFGAVADDIQRISDDYHQKVINELLGGSDGFNALFHEKKAVPAVFLHFSTTILFLNEGKPSFHLVRAFASMSADPLPDDVWEKLKKLNLSLHNRVEKFDQSTEIC